MHNLENIPKGVEALTPRTRFRFVVLQVQGEAKLDFPNGQEKRESSDNPNTPPPHGMGGSGRQVLITIMAWSIVSTR
jgi:hypothetical protein